MKKRILLAALSILAVTGASAQEKLETPWTKAGFVGLKFTQSSFTNWASGNRYSSMNRTATHTCFFWKNVTNVAKNSLKMFEAVASHTALSDFGLGKMYL